MIRRWLLIGGGALGGLVLGAIAAILLFYPRIGEWAIREKVLPRLADRLDREIRVGDIEVRRGSVVLTDLVVLGPGDREAPLARVPRLEATFDFSASLFGTIDVDRVTVTGLEATVVRHADGSDNVRDLLDLVRADGSGGSGGGGSGGSGLGALRPDAIRIVDGNAVVYDAGGASIRARGVGAILGTGDEVTIAIDEVGANSGLGPDAALRAVMLTVDARDPLGSAHAEIGDGQVRLWSGMTLTGIHGAVRQGETPGRLLIDLEGGYGGAEGTLWKADGWVDPRARAGELDVEADRFTFDRIAPVLEDSIVIDYENTSVDASMHVEVADGRAALEGAIDIEGLNVFHPMAAEEPMRDLSAEGTLSARFDSVTRIIESHAELSSKGVDYALDASYALPHGIDAETGERREQPRGLAHLVIPPVRCQTMLDSIPAEFAPKLQGFELKGTFETDLKVVVDWADFEATELEGFVGIRGCRVIEEPPEFDARRLTATFEHQILVGPDEWETVTIGMESDNYAPIFDISSHFLKAIMTTEDSRFYDHKGFIAREFRTALVKDLEAGYFKYGASSITMQMVKNVFLHREKTLSRKVQELFLTWYVEQVLEKNRILEIYVNAIEYGPGVYGIVAASSIYFDKHPRNLEAHEAAYLASLLPAPRRRYFQYCQDKVSRWTKNKVQRVLKLMHKRDRLTELELEDALVADFEFNPVKRKDLCKKRPDW